MGENGERIQSGECTGHEGAVWQAAWAHPQFGSLVATCGYDARVLVFRESASVQQGVPSTWVRVYAFEGHKASGEFCYFHFHSVFYHSFTPLTFFPLSQPTHPPTHPPTYVVNSVAWAPPEFGLQLAAASADGRVSILTHREDDTWDVVTFSDCPMGCNAVSWAPYSSAAPLRRIAVAGCDGNVRLHCAEGGGPWVNEEQPLSVSAEWVRDVAWCPAGLALSASAAADALLFAACADDGRVTFFRQTPGSREWAVSYLPAFKAPVWKVSWSVTGRLLAVSCGDNTVTVWKEDVSGSTWQQVSSVPIA